MNKTTFFCLLCCFLGIHASLKSQIASYCTSNATSTIDSKIDSVILNTIVHGTASSTCETYTDNTHLSTTLQPGGAYTLYVTNGTCGNYYTNYKRAWIDYDQNGVFDDPAERIMDVTSSSAGQTQSSSFIIPAGALSGNTFMRVISRESGVPSPCGTYAYGETEDYSITIKSTAINDGGVVELVEPSTRCEGVHEVKVQIANFGINQIDSIQVHWSIDGTVQPVTVYNQLLDTLNGQNPYSASVVLGNTTLTGGNSYTIKVWTALPNNQPDTTNLNDTISETLEILPIVTSFPYIEDFENGQGDWYMNGTNSSWAFGTPSKTNISGAASGVNAFVTGGLTGSYNTSESSYVGSPCFDLSAIESTAWLALDINWSSENNYDGAVLQASTDGGKTWRNVGAVGDDFNWYNQASLVGQPGGQTEGWGGTVANASGGWLKAKHQLDPSLLKKNVQFRIAFGSDASVVYDGFAFDNFAVVDFKEANLGPDRISLCGGSEVTLDPHVNFNGTIAWSNGDTINEKIQVIKEDTIWVTYTDTLLDLETSDTVIIIQSPAPSIGFTSMRDTISLQGQITLDPHTDFELTHNWMPGNHPYPYLLVKGSEWGVGQHTFTLTVQDSVLCEDQATVVVVVVDITGIAKKELGSIRYYPNPVSDQLNIELSNFGNEAIQIQLTDMLGKTVLSKTMSQNLNQPIRLDVSSLHSGNYLLHVMSGNRLVTTKLVVN